MMKKMKTRLLTFMAVMLCSIPLAAQGWYPAYGPTFVVDKLTYRVLSDSTVEVVHNDTIKQYGDVVIPEKVVYEDKDRQVVSIESRAFVLCDSLERIVLPAGITHIGYNAFEGCDRLLTVVCQQEKPLLSDEYNGVVFSPFTLKLGTLIVPEGTRDAYRDPGTWDKPNTIWPRFQNISDNGGRPYHTLTIVTHSKVVYELNGKRHTAYGTNTQTADLTEGERVELVFYPNYKGNYKEGDYTVYDMELGEFLVDSIDAREQLDNQRFVIDGIDHDTRIDLSLKPHPSELRIGQDNSGELVIVQQAGRNFQLKVVPAEGYELTELNHDGYTYILGNPDFWKDFGMYIGNNEPSEWLRVRFTKQ